jgi:hypothetical protein
VGNPGSRIGSRLEGHASNPSSQEQISMDFQQEHTQNMAAGTMAISGLLTPKHSLP